MLHGLASAYISSLSLYHPAHWSSARFLQMRPWKKKDMSLSGRGMIREWRREAFKGRKPAKGILSSIFMMGSWGSTPMKTLGRLWGEQNMPPGHPSRGMGRLGHVSTNPFIIGWEQLLGHQLPGTSSLPNMLTQHARKSRHCIQDWYKGWWYRALTHLPPHFY